MTSVRGAVVALTGAASGIGRALALELAERNCELALGDRDEAGLLAVAAEIARTSPQKLTTHIVDVSKPDQIQDFAQKAISDHPNLNILVNNAGVALIGEFHEIDQKQMDWLMNVNFWGVVHATRAFLPHLERQREAHIVNVSSIFGIIAPPGQTAYAAAKFAVRGFSESLRHELETAGSPIRLSTLRAEPKRWSVSIAWREPPPKPLHSASSRALNRITRASWSDSMRSSRIICSDSNLKRIGSSSLIYSTSERRSKPSKAEAVREEA